MNTITVNKEELLRTLRENKAEHEEQYKAASVAYRKKLVAQLEKKLAKAKAGKNVKTYFTLPEPEKHTDSFETAIQMLEWEEDSVVRLDSRDFQRFVQNQWEWAHSFASNTGSYLS